MKHIKHLILILLLVIALYGCDGDDDKNQKTKIFVGGTKGLDISFMPGAPPNEVFDSEDYKFNINVRVENIGEWPVDDAVVKITGINPEDYSKSLGDFTLSVGETLEETKINPDGDIIRGSITDIEFTDLYKSEPVAGTIESTIRSEICYGYGTQVNADVCVLEALLGTERRTEVSEVCNPNEPKKAENSGAPVHVQDLKQTVIGSDKLSFSFKVKHIGTGKISELGSDCSDTYSSRDKVNILVETGISGDLNCMGLSGGNQGTVILYDNVREITCTQSLPSDRGNYEKQIDITLEYDYEDYVDMTLKVKHALE
jgi:hypothetical protein